MTAVKRKRTQTNRANIQGLQMNINYYNTGTTRYENIEPSGDALREREESDTYIRIAFQNIRGVTRNEDVPSEIDAMHELGIDIMGMSETNCPWTPTSRVEYDLVMKEIFGPNRTVYSSAPAHTDSTYQPGGTLLTTHGRTTGRIAKTGTDPWGRFCWMQLRGRRDEGITIISAYRVCQNQSSHTAGPYTAYRQQYTLMRDAGYVAPDPRQQVLTDLTKLIESHRSEGYRPIVMMDANGDYSASTNKDKALERFLIDNNLVDPYFDKFKSSPRTFAYGTRRIDYIFTDPICVQAIQGVGYLGTHQGAFSDHCLAFIDVDERKLFQGILNRPVPHHSREITIAQEDKIQRFLELFTEQLVEHSVHTRTLRLADHFAIHGASDKNVQVYHTIYNEFLELARASAKKAGRKKLGYMRSLELTTRARILLAYKQMYDCKCRRAPISPALQTRCTQLGIDSDHLESLTIQALRKQIRERRKELWEAQKTCESLRREWLVEVAKDRARASQDKDWTKKLTAMIRTAQRCATNRRLTMITKGVRGVLDRIQIPTHDWFYSPRYDELYHYDDGVFEAYPSKGDDTFFTHHTLKVLPDDAELVEVDHDEETDSIIVSNQLPRPPVLWEDISSQELIEQHLLRRNKRHLEQTSRESGVSTQPLLQDIRMNHGINPLTEDLLDGTFDTTYILSPEMVAFFEQLKRSPTSSSQRPILGTISSEEFQAMFKIAREQTSSDTRTLNYSIWKCIASSDFISSFASILLSLPFTYGFVNNHWTHMSDYMLEKKPGQRQIHTLRIIGKVAAEFNTCLKFFIGKQAMHNFEDSNPCDEQHGFRPDRSSVDAAMLKLLTFECARLQRATVGMIQHDMAAHFDRMSPSMTNIYAQRYNVSENILQTISGTIARLTRNVETAMGLSQATYSQEEDAPEIGGMVQGKADVPQLSTQQSEILLRAHKSMTQGLSMPNPLGTREINHHSISFADDTDQHTNVDSRRDDAIPAVVGQLQHSAQTWNNLINIPGGLLAYHKCNWQLIAWSSESGYMDMVTQTDQSVVIQDGKGAASTIDFLPPKEPNVGLGYRLCPNADQDPHYQSVILGIRKMCAGLGSAHLTEHEIRQLLTQRLIPKLTYALHLSSFSPSQCGQIDTIIRQKIIPRMRLNRHFPSAVLYGPIELGGLDFMEVRTLQLTTQVSYVLKQLRWDKTVANDIIVTLDTLQLASGLSQPLMEYPSTPISYIGASYFLHIREQLAEINASLWIEDVWKPQPHREHDEFIMDKFLQIPGITNGELRQANAVRLYMRILTIADIADPSGEFIPDGMLTGDWQAGTDIYWPYQARPPPEFWAVFRRCLRLTFCTSTSPNQPITNGMDLDKHLGVWLPVKRHVWFDAYRSETMVYWRDDDIIYQMIPSAPRGYYVRGAVVEELPIEAHPISVHTVGDRIWTHRSYKMGNAAVETQDPTGYMIRDTMQSYHPFLIVCSDASTHHDTEMSTCAWIISATSKQMKSMCAHIQNVSSNTSYRGELEGLYRALRATLQLQPERVELWCDNKAAVDKSAQKRTTPGMMIQADADVILAIHKLIRDFSGQVTFHHVYGHQDTRRREDKQGSPTLSRVARLNIECDRLANETAIAIQQSDAPLPTLQPPYPGSKALLRINGRWITSKEKLHIKDARHRSALWEYCKSKYNWTEETMRTILWAALKKARTAHTLSTTIRTSKVMHGWLPVMHQQGRITGSTQCPGCEEQDETFDHMIQCTHEWMQVARRQAIINVREAGVKQRLPIGFMNNIQQYLRITLTGSNEVQDRDLAGVMRSQQTIGHKMFLRGFLSTGWLRLLRSYESQDTELRMAKLIRIIWDKVIKPLWATRNDILHRSANYVTESIHTELGDRLIWYTQHKDELSRRDQFLASHTLAQIEAMTTSQRREWVRHLDVARAAWTKERTTIAAGQGLITQYFKPRDTNT